MFSFHERLPGHAVRACAGTACGLPKSDNGVQTGSGSTSLVLRSRCGPCLPAAEAACMCQKGVESARHGAWHGPPACLCASTPGTRPTHPHLQSTDGRVRPDVHPCTPPACRFAIFEAANQRILVGIVTRNPRWRCPTQRSPVAHAAGSRRLPRPAQPHIMGKPPNVPERPPWPPPTRPRPRTVQTMPK